MLVLIVATFLWFDAPPPTPATPAPIAWQGVTLGEKTDAVIARFGAPSSRRKAMRGTYLIEYPAFGGAGTLQLTDSGGTISGIRVSVDDASVLRKPILDPFGVALGDAADRLTQLRGQPQRYDDEGNGEFTSYYGKPSEARWTYGLRNASVYAIGVIMPYRVVRATGVVTAVGPTPRPADAPTPPPPDASSMDRAVKVTPEDVAADNQFEYTYVERVACGSGDHWAPRGDSVINARRRNFRRIDAECPSTGETRSFFFDITAVFGRNDT